ncbi:MAG: TauD/TfdA family dioxygenase [Crocinitomicaceae bacterium]
MKGKLKGLKNIKAKSVDTNDRVKTLPFENAHGFPLVVSTDYSDLNIGAWMETNRESIDKNLTKFGGILFRGFNVNTVEKFQGFMAFFENEKLEYKLRSSPRHAVGEKVYVSTEYPKEQSINMHCESSYAPSHPNKIAFCCLIPAEKGGETPIADTRKVFNEISEATREKFQEKGVKYRRFFSGRSGMSWEEAFQTESKDQVEEECQLSGIDYQWINDNELILTWTKKAIWEHPNSGEKIWFNHALFFNENAAGYEELRAVLETDQLPNNTFYGDGTNISKEEIQELTQAFEKSTIEFQWKTGDVLLLDNLLMAHGRNPFEGERKIIVSMI